MNMDMLSRGFDILQRAGGMEQISQLMVIVYGVLCVFGLLNCILGYRILRFWMMIFGFIIGAGAGFGVTYMSGVQDKMVIAGAMAGLGIVLAVVSFLIYRAGIFVLGFGIGITLSIYLVHPTSSFSFFPVHPYRRGTGSTCYALCERSDHCRNQYTGWCSGRIIHCKDRRAGAVSIWRRYGSGNCDPWYADPVRHQQRPIR